MAKRIDLDTLLFIMVNRLKPKFDKIGIKCDNVIDFYQNERTKNSLGINFSFVYKESERPPFRSLLCVTLKKDGTVCIVFGKKGK